MTPTQITEPTRVSLSLKSKRFRYVAIMLSLMVLGVCGGCICVAPDSDDSKEMDVDLQKVTVRSVPGTDCWRMCLDVVLTNRTSGTFCILPSEMAVEYRLEHADGSSDTEMWGSKTVSTSARSIAELDVPVVRLQPGAMKSLSLCQVVTSKPRVGSGLLKCSLRCSPFYPDSTLAEGVVFHRELRLQSRVNIVYDPTSSEFIMTPVPHSSADNR